MGGVAIDNLEENYLIYICCLKLLQSLVSSHLSNIVQQVIERLYSFILICEFPLFEPLVVIICRIYNEFSSRAFRLPHLGLNELGHASDDFRFAKCSAINGDHTVTSFFPMR